LWWLYYIPQLIISTTLRTSKKLFSFFSIDLLLRTLLLPWKRDEIDTTNMSLEGKFQVWIMNIVSRLVGAVVRSFTILFGLLAIIFTVVVGAVSLIGIISLPVLGVLIIILGLV